MTHLPSGENRRMGAGETGEAEEGFTCTKGEGGGRGGKGCSV